MRGATSAAPSGGLKVVARGSVSVATGSPETISFQEDVAVVFVSLDNNGGSWIPGGPAIAPMVVFSPAVAMKVEANGDGYSAQLMDSKTLRLINWDNNTPRTFGYLALG